MRVIGTAGHVDHGKSTLVEALTGMDPDRLREEKERAMTIDLGFAWLALPGGEVVSIVDVPGHEDFIRNMLSGVGGIDLALLVIAADESVMPQTREHLHILNLLEVPRGIAVLTKCDLVEEEEWLELVELEVAETLAGTTLEEAPILRVSARTGEGLPQLLQTLEQMLSESDPRQDYGRPRLSVDRVFSVSGFGTVVTGTLLDGTLALGDEVEFLPSGLSGRVRGLQTNREKVERATPGRRLAVNVSNVEVSEVQRGDLLAHPGDYRPTRLLDVSLRLLPDARRPLKHNQEVEFFHGAAQRSCYLRLIGSREIQPGEEGLAQLRFSRPVAVARGDRYILRQPSPSETLGGGTILDPVPRRRWRRFRPDTLERFRTLLEGSPVDLLEQKVILMEPTSEPDLLAALPLPGESGRAALQEALAGRRVYRLKDGVLLSAAGRNRRREQLLRDLAAYHKQYPLRHGMPREEAASRLHLKPKSGAFFLDDLAEEGAIVQGANWVALAGWQIRLTPEQERKITTLLARFDAAPYTPPNPGESIEAVGEELVNYLVARGDLVRLSNEVLLGRQAYDEMVEGARALFKERGDITAGELRDRFNTSRKYAIALLEHLDSIKMTRRIGDRRILR